MQGIFENSARISQMLFNSGVFLLWFLPLVLAFYYLLPERFRMAVLLIASYIFYASWNIFFCSLMLISTCIDYIAGKKIAASNKRNERKLFLIVSLFGNLALLGFFKYYGMFAETIEILTGNSSLPLWHIILPVGISFYTFQSMSYSIDIYRKDAKPTGSFLKFATYVSLFPQLVAGPIVRYSEIADQLQKRKHTWDLASEGLYRFVRGLAKKVLVADSMAYVANAAFTAETLGSTDAWLGVFAYSFQIYFDFSGYSDMAIGLGLLFGFRFPENFDRPYLSKNISEFWRRWHMTLSSWFRDYVYVPLGGNRSGRRRTLINLTLTMFLAGLWHGAAWTFVVWGLLHGVLLVLHRILGEKFQQIPLILKVGVTFLLVTLLWIPFRSPDFTHALWYFSTLFSRSSLNASHILPLLIVGLGCSIALFEHKILSEPTKPTIQKALGLGALFLLCLVVIFGNSASPFLYFQF